MGLISKTRKYIGAIVRRSVEAILNWSGLEVDMAFNFAAPAQPGFSFAGGAAAAGNPPSAATGTTGGFGNFGVGASFSLGQQQQLMGSSLPSLGAPSTAPPPPTLPTITVPPYKEIFPNRSIWCKISDLLHSLSAQDDYSEDATLAGQELIHLLDSMQLQEPRSIASGLLAPRSNQLILEPVQPDIALRQRLFQNPLIVLSIEHEDGSILLQEATLTQSMLTDICSIADDLQITEVAAICLYHQASSAKAKFRSRFVQACLKDSTIVTKDDTSLAWMARDIFFAQSPLRIRTCLLLLQWRLREGNQDRSQNPVSEATDALFQSDWIGQLIRLVRDYTRRIDVTIAAINAHAAGHGPSISNSLEPCRENDSLFWRHNVVLRMCMKERQSTAECLFFAAYHVQLTVDEVGALIDLTQELSNGALILDPFTDVPDPYESAARENPSAGVAHWLMRDSSRSEKDQLNWQRELASAAWQTGQPQLLRCTCGIAMAIISALGDRAILNDRTSHLPNSFGTVCIR